MISRTENRLVWQNYKLPLLHQSTTPSLRVSQILSYSLVQVGVTFSVARQAQAESLLTMHHGKRWVKDSVGPFLHHSWQLETLRRSEVFLPSLGRTWFRMFLVTGRAEYISLWLPLLLASKAACVPTKSRENKTPEPTDAVRTWRCSQSLEMWSEPEDPVNTNRWIVQYSETWITRTAGDHPKSLNYGRFQLWVLPSLCSRHMATVPSPFCSISRLNFLKFEIFFSCEMKTMKLS